MGVHTPYLQTLDGLTVISTALSTEQGKPLPLSLAIDQEKLLVEGGSRGNDDAGVHILESPTRRLVRNSHLHYEVGSLRRRRGGVLRAVCWLLTVALGFKTSR